MRRCRRVLYYTERYRSGHNGADSKQSRPADGSEHEKLWFICTIRTFRCSSYEFHLAVFPQFSRTQFNSFQTGFPVENTWRDIEVVITALTRNQVYTWVYRGFESLSLRHLGTEIVDFSAFFIHITSFTRYYSPLWIIRILSQHCFLFF